jgi:hypothetical protein
LRKSLPFCKSKGVATILFPLSFTGIFINL